MSEKEKTLLGMVQYYERTLRDMQKCVFFAQDDEGALRRWYPPRPISYNGVLYSKEPPR